MDARGNSQSLDDTPCIGICSATQWGDAICKGCGRTVTEIRDWNQLPPIYKKLVVLRAVDEGYTPRQVYIYENDPDKDRNRRRICPLLTSKDKPSSPVRKWDGNTRTLRFSSRDT